MHVYAYAYIYIYASVLPALAMLPWQCNQQKVWIWKQPCCPGPGSMYLHEVWNQNNTTHQKEVFVLCVCAYVCACVCVRAHAAVFRVSVHSVHSVLRCVCILQYIAAIFKIIYLPRLAQIQNLQSLSFIISLTLFMFITDGVECIVNSSDNQLNMFK